MESIHYIGLDVQKKTISHCIKTASNETSPRRRQMDVWTPDRADRKRRIKKVGRHEGLQN